MHKWIAQLSAQRRVENERERERGREGGRESLRQWGESMRLITMSPDCSDEVAECRCLKLVQQVICIIL